MPSALRLASGDRQLEQTGGEDPYSDQPWADVSADHGTNFGRSAGRPETEPRRQVVNHPLLSLGSLDMLNQEATVVLGDVLNGELGDSTHRTTFSAHALNGNDSRPVDGEDWFELDCLADE